MSTDKPLTATQSAFLALLMAEAREVSNTELKAKYGISISGKDSAALLDRKFATYRKLGRGLSHELTDDGWAEAKRMMAADYVKLQGAGPASAALHAVLAAVQRFMQRADKSAAEIFAPSELPPAPAPVAKPRTATGTRIKVPLRITNAYKKLQKDPVPWVSLTDLRVALKGLTRDQVDAGLMEMLSKKKIRLIPEENQKTITAADRDAAITVSGEDKHLMGMGLG